MFSTKTRGVRLLNDHEFTTNRDCGDYIAVD